MRVESYAEHLDPLLAPSIRSERPILEKLYRLVIQIFMLIEYDVKNAILALHKWVNWSPSILPQHLSVSSKNMANPQALGICVALATHKVSKEVFKNLGKKEGFRVVEDMDLNPTRGSKGLGLCFGMSAVFLASYLANRQTSESIAIRGAAEHMRDGADPKSLSLHTLYDGLMPSRVDLFNLIQWRGLLQNPLHEPNVSMEQKKNLLDSIRKFLSAPDKEALNESFKQFVLNDMELKGAQITPECYAIILDLDALFYAQKNHIPQNRVYEPLHLAIQDIVLNKYGLKIEKADVFDGSRNEAVEKIKNLAEGSYLIELPGHTTALVKMSDGSIALFNPELGTAITRETSPVIINFLNHYFPGKNISCSIISLRNP